MSLSREATAIGTAAESEGVSLRIEIPEKVISDELHVALKHLAGFGGLLLENGVTYALFSGVTDEAALRDAIAIALVDVPAPVPSPDYPAEYVAARTLEEKIDVIARKLALT